jgi:hypothetical protein
MIMEVISNSESNNKNEDGHEGRVNSSKYEDESEV